MPRMTGGAAIVQSLIDHGTNTLFALPGVQLDPFFNALHDAGKAIRVLHSRHEQGAAYMAMGYAASTGKPGVYAVVPGPGFLNTTAALSTAYAIHAPMFCVTGEIPSRHMGKGFGMLHEIPDQLGILRSLTKWARHIDTPQEVPGAMGEAFLQLTSGRPRPVGVQMAWDRMAEEADVDMGGPLPPPQRPEVDPEAVEAAARLLGSAQAPAIFVGSGAIEAREEVAALAELIQAPVVMDRLGLGILPAGHDLAQTTLAGYRLWGKTDVVLAVGTRLQVPQMIWGLDDNLKIVRIDIDPEESDRFAPPAVNLLADSREALKALIPAIEKHNRKRANRADEMAAVRHEVEEDTRDLDPQRAFVAAIREALPPDGLFVEEITQMGYVGRFAFPVHAPRTYITSGYQGTLGSGYATALGVKAAHPDKPVVAISGDGGFMYTMPELATALQHDLPVVVCVFNDGAFGNVKRMQKELYGGREIASTLRNPDFVKLAESFGAMGLKATTPVDLRTAIEKGLAANVPTLIEVPVGEFADPWKHINRPRIRGKK